MTPVLVTGNYPDFLLILLNFIEKYLWTTAFRFIYCNDFILDSKTHLHVVFSVQDSAEFNISQGASCAASVARSLNTNLIAPMKRALMGFLPLNSQFSHQIECLNKNSPYISVAKVGRSDNSALWWKKGGGGGGGGSDIFVHEKREAKNFSGI